MTYIFHNITYVPYYLCKELFFSNL